MTEEQAREFAAWLHGKRAALIVRMNNYNNDSIMFHNLYFAQQQLEEVQEYLVEKGIGIPKYPK